MNIHQMSVSYVEGQDRLMLRVNTPEGQEFRLWLTRRLTGRLLPPLKTCMVQLETRQPQVLAADSNAQQMLTELKREISGTADSRHPSPAHLRNCRWGSNLFW